MNQQQNGRMEGWKNGRMEGWKDGRMEGWKNGRMEGWKEGIHFTLHVSHITPHISEKGVL